MNDNAQNMLSAFMNVNLGSISRNYHKISKFVEPSICAATVKADAYGLGLEKLQLLFKIQDANIFRIRFI